MANGFGSLYVGASGLQNAQNAINTTANNLANVDTKAQKDMSASRFDMPIKIIQFLKTAELM